MIDKIIYINLDRSLDRKAWFLENMEAAGVPMGIVERFPAKDWQDYDSVKDTIRQMNKASGFAPHILTSEHRCTKDDEVSMLRGVAAYVWTVSDVLKSIIDSDTTTLVLHDDTAIISWDNLISSFDGLLPWLDSYHKPLHAIQFIYGKTNWLPNPVMPFNEIWNHGIAIPHEGAVAFSFHGASRMLALMQYNSEHLMNMEKLLYEHFNNYNTFHPRDGIQFMKVLDSPRTITSGVDL